MNQHLLDLFLEIFPLALKVIKYQLQTKTCIIHLLAVITITIQVGFLTNIFCLYMYLYFFPINFCFPVNLHVQHMVGPIINRMIIVILVLEVVHIRYVVAHFPDLFFH